jgi:ABC-type sugar transport system ATPase subunit
MSIEVRDVSKRFGAFQELQQVGLQVETGELVALGPSGSAKTTLPRIIAGPVASGPLALCRHHWGAHGGLWACPELSPPG